MSYGIGQAIIFLPCGFYLLLLHLLLLFFLAYSQRSEIGCLPYFYTWRGLSANLECRSEMCCMRLDGNTGCKNYAKNRHLHTIAQLYQAVSSQLRHVSTIGKNLLNSNIFSTCLHNMVNFGPLAAEIGSTVWGTPADFSGFHFLLRYCSDIAHRRPAKLCMMFGRLLGWYTIYTFSGALAPWQNFAHCQMISLIVRTLTRMWADAQRDGRPAEYRWRPLFNAAKFGWRPIMECCAVMLPRRETLWN